MKYVKRIPLALLTYLLLFGAKLKVFDISVFFAVLLAAYYYYDIVANGKVNYGVARLVVYLCFLTGFLALVTGWSGTALEPLLNEFGKLILYLSAAAGLVQVYRQVHGQGFPPLLLGDILAALFITAALVDFLFLAPGLRNEIYSHLDLYIFKYRVAESLTERVVDLSVGGSTVSLMLVFGFVLWSMRTPPQSIGWKTFRNVAVYLMFFAATLLTSRTGMFVFVAYSAFLCVRDMRERPRYFAGYVGIGLAIAGVTVLVAINFMDEILLSYLTERVAPWAFEFVYRYFDEGTFATKSTNYLLEQYVVPQTLGGFLFGGGDYDVPSDPSFVKMMSAAGLLGLSLALAFFVIASRMGMCNSGIMRRPLIAYTVLLMIGNTKETMLGNSRGAILLYFVLLIAAVYASTRSPLAKSPVGGTG